MSEQREVEAIYRKGFEDGIRAYAYSTSEPWGESGVQYVGTTGRRLADAIEEAPGHPGYDPPLEGFRHE